MSLEAGGLDTVLARWDDAGVPRVMEYGAPDPANRPQFPELPENSVANDPGLLKALDEAAQTTARETHRYALSHIQLRGKPGEIVATDGKQLLVQGGFQFPWPEDLLVARPTVFGGREIPGDVPVRVGHTETHVAVQSGPWTIHLAIDRHGRFPPTDQVIPRLTASATQLRIAPQDAEFLARTLPRLPGNEDENAPVTVDLDGQVVVRARAQGQSRITEVKLERSECSGKAVRFSIDRRLLARAVQMGLREAFIVDAERPAVFRDEHRQFVWMPLAKDTAIGPSEEALCVPSAGGEAVARQTEAAGKAADLESRAVGEPANPVPQAVSEPANPEPPADPRVAVAQKFQVQDNVAKRLKQGSGVRASGAGINSLIEEAQALRDLLRDAYSRTGRLVAAIKRHRTQGKLLQTTLASLKHLRQVAG